jgi:hypothetical protein
LCIRARTDADVVTFDRTDEGFGHSIALWTFDWRRSRFEADVASEAACLACDVTAAIVGQPLDTDTQASVKAPEHFRGITLRTLSPRRIPGLRLIGMPIAFASSWRTRRRGLTRHPMRAGRVDASRGEMKLRTHTRAQTPSTGQWRGQLPNPVDVEWNSKLMFNEKFRRTSLGTPASLRSSFFRLHKKFCVTCEIGHIFLHQSGSTMRLRA